MCITGLVVLLLTVTASMLSYPVHLLSMAFSFTMLPPDVAVRVLLFLGATVGPVFCGTASSIASSTDGAAVLGQLRAAVRVLRFRWTFQAGAVRHTTVRCLLQGRCPCSPSPTSRHGKPPHVLARLQRTCTSACLFLGLSQH